MYFCNLSFAPLRQFKEMLHKPEDSVRIAIENIQPGMFVTAIERNTKVNLTTAGVVSGQKGIQQLINSGVRYVWVDVSLSSSKCTFVIAPEAEPVQTEPEASEANTQAVKLTDSELKKKRAQKLVSDAKSLANKIIQGTFEGRPLEVGELDKWADGVIDEVLDNSDAIKLVLSLRNKDNYLLEHSVNVSCLLVIFGKYLKLENKQLKCLAIGGMLHDLGKTKVRDEVLNKPGQLTSDEFEHMKLHQVFVSELLGGVKGLSSISKFVCLMHHEKLDGSGYPNKLKGEQIPFYGRMSSIVDIYDALTAERCYKNGMSPSDAFKILLGMTPHQLDQALVYKFINCLGIHPVGSLVLLSDNSVGIVEAVDHAGPQVKCFYSLKYRKYIEIRTMKLAESELAIERALAPASLGIDISPFYD